MDCSSSSSCACELMHSSDWPATPLPLLHHTALTAAMLPSAALHRLASGQGCVLTMSVGVAPRWGAAAKLAGCQASCRAIAVGDSLPLLPVGLNSMRPMCRLRAAAPAGARP